MEGIYDDIATFDFSEELSKTNADIQQLRNEIQLLKDENKRIRLTNEMLEKKNKIIVTNISSLYQTAKLEIDRKDKRIAALQQELQDVVFRRNKKINGNCNVKYDADEADLNLEKQVTAHWDDGLEDNNIKESSTIPTETDKSKNVILSCTQIKTEPRSMSRESHKSNEIHEHENVVGKIKPERISPYPERNHRHSHSSRERGHGSRNSHYRSSRERDLDSGNGHRYSSRERDPSLRTPAGDLRTTINDFSKRRPETIKRRRPDEIDRRRPDEIDRRRPDEIDRRRPEENQRRQMESQSQRRLQSRSRSRSPLRRGSINEKSRNRHYSSTRNERRRH